MDSDGSNVQRLTEFEAWGGRPSWSPDGERIAFVRNFDGIWKIYVMDSDGSNVQRLTHTPGRDASSFAPESSTRAQKTLGCATRFEA